jgi:hypothetical protein
MNIFNVIGITLVLAAAVWLLPGMLGGLITTFALRREKGSLQAIDVITIAGKWMFTCFLGGLVTFMMFFLISAVVPDGTTFGPAVDMLLEYVCFAAGAAVMGARGAKNILEVLNYG